MKKDRITKTNIPFIVRFSEERGRTEAVSGYYSDIKDIWVIENISGVVPAILCNAVFVHSLKTMTRMGGERED